MTQRSKAILLGAAVVAAVALITYLNRATPNQGALVQEVQQAERPVQTLVARPSALLETLDLAGALEAIRDVMLTAEVGGKVLDIHKHLGDACAKGESILQLDAETYRLALAEAEAALAQAQTAHQEATRDLQRARQLRAKELVSQRELERGEARAATAAATVARAESSAQLARRSLRETAIRCPFDAVIAERLVNEGQLLGPQTAVARVVDNTALELSLSASAAELGRLKKGQIVDVFDRAAPNAKLRGTVSHLGIAADRTTRTFPVKVAVEPAPHGPKPGQLVQASIQIANHSDALAVPLAALDQDTGTPRVWRVVDGRAQPVNIEIGAQAMGRVLVAAGLEPGDEVIVVGGRGLQANQQVKVIHRVDGPELEPSRDIRAESNP